MNTSQHNVLNITVASARVSVQKVNENIQARKRQQENYKIGCPTEFNDTNSRTVFHNLCRDQQKITAPLVVCARSGCLCTIYSDVTQKREFHHYISDCRLTILGRVFTQTGQTALPSSANSAPVVVPGPGETCTDHDCGLHGICSIEHVLELLSSCS